MRTKSVRSVAMKWRDRIAAIAAAMASMTFMKRTQHERPERTVIARASAFPGNAAERSQRNSSDNAMSLGAAVKLRPTPDANAWKGGTENQRRGQLNGSLNPTWVEWLMGYPSGWTVLDASAMPSSRKSPKNYCDGCSNVGK